MAGLPWIYQSGEIALSAGVEKFPAYIAAAANIRELIHELDISFKGIDPTDTPVRVLLQEVSTAPSTSGSAQNPIFEDRGVAEAIQVTGRKGDTVTGVVTNTLRTFEVHPQDGKTYYFVPPLTLKGGGKLQVSCLAVDGNSVAINIRGEE